MTPYDILAQRLLPLRNLHRAPAQREHLSVRAQAICELLRESGLEPKLDLFSEPTGARLCNISVEFNGTTDEEKVVFTAHHDVNNLQSDNVLDNTASLANLLALAARLAQAPPTRGCTIVFTDNEEFGASGARRLAQQVLAGELGPVLGIVNSELTASGRVWLDSAEQASLSLLLQAACPGAPLHPTPFNDSHVFRRHGIPSVCLGLLPEEELQQLLKRGYCKTWGECHKLSDDLHHADPQSMQSYVDLLESLVAREFTP